MPILMIYLLMVIKRLIARRELYRINDITVFSSVNGLGVYKKVIYWKKNKNLFRCIDQLIIEIVHKITER